MPRKKVAKITDPSTLPQLLTMDVKQEKNNTRGLNQNCNEILHNHLSISSYADI